MSLSARQESLLRRTFLDYRPTSEFLKRPLLFDRAEGLYVWDNDGRQYFDAIGGVFNREALILPGLHSGESSALSHSG